jgi:hypothetical protein
MSEINIQNYKTIIADLEKRLKDVRCSGITHPNPEVMEADFLDALRLEKAALEKEMDKLGKKG